jgi:hypothetical protein
MVKQGVNILFSVHDAFLQSPSSSTLKDFWFGKSNNLKVFGGKNTKDPMERIEKLDKAFNTWGR